MRFDTGTNLFLYQPCKTSGHRTTACRRSIQPLPSTAVATLATSSSPRTMTKKKISESSPAAPCRCGGRVGVYGGGERRFAAGMGMRECRTLGPSDSRTNLVLCFVVLALGFPFPKFVVQALSTNAVTLRLLYCVFLLATKVYGGLLVRAQLSVKPKTKKAMSGAFRSSAIDS
eukprot:838973-Rhodomonas_salina.1